MNDPARGPVDPQRRQFLQLAVVGAGALLLAPGCGDPPADPRALLDAAALPELDASQLPATAVERSEILTAYFGEAELPAVAVLGTFVRAGVANAEALAAAARRTLGLVAAAPTAAAAATALERAVRADFEALRLRNLRGWQVARTEADLCVLAELLVGS